MKPRLLDLFSGAGGAAVGYARAGFEVVGVDHRPQPEYPFEFFEMDVFEALRGVEGFDAIHASPPCQAYSWTRYLGNRSGEDAPELVEPTRKALMAIGVPWVMENVMGAPLVNPLRLCGSSFGLGVRRHRLFESSELIFGLPCAHRGLPRPITVVGDHPQTSHDRSYRMNRARTLAEGREAMGIDWMTWKPLTQAIPPAFTEHIGRQLLASMRAAA